MTLINQYGEPQDPFKALGPCAICGADAWTTTDRGLRCDYHDTHPSTDRTLYWFARTYGLDFADAQRMAAYEAETDAGHATRVSILMNCDHMSFNAARAIVAATDADFDREELGEAR